MQKTPTILAATALAVAVLGSTPLGHAAGNLILAKNSVGTAQLKASAVTGAKVKDHSLTAADFAAGQLPAGAQGPQGLQGAQGPKGDTGPAGAAGATDVVVRTKAGTSVAAGSSASATVFCNAGERATGGGLYSTGKVFVEQSYPGASPGSTPKSWGVTAYNADATTQAFTAFVVCAAP